ncbi:MULTISPECIES: hypothetical protein [Methylobacterium]|jgi:hypothetical protein|uniref:Large exoprotein involved in heme utilization or adhesion n=2 Tax=Pseudomonadota TaxID=1224 RepID=A0ABQ4T0B1_9HYPH|nr:MULTISPECIES: hypothetical protein [Methylobacterium]PIU04978.1 MAG: hypothetical protein COT56_17045 [Methylobacterium sp. CG09_land_8_20_14_0_10_71_15]PIU11479.1 MAG: hypothetical protein COT28_19540 [Methylobacterium sp. CG08_land_8_20_14_0_20_71_15]GBU16541.1 hypothetical protein AwMethylo_07560 [Methylobacterium sp.]GJE07653.1 hypothetical protein AOPFMNJM_2982 [Methylobacterium jeotgali]
MKSTLSLAALLLAAGVGAAEAARKPVAVSDAYDGTWSIEVITTSGPCDRAYRYGVKIEKGEARYPGADFNISGRVAGNGAVRATISRGSDSANVTGRLDRSGMGTGTWKATGGCSGNWNAERRG